MTSISAESKQILSFINSSIDDRIIESFILEESAQHHLIKADVARSGSSVALSISRNNIKTLISLVEKSLGNNHELLGNVPEVTKRGRQSSQPQSDMLFTAKACLCKDTEQGFSISPCGDIPWRDITQKGSHDSYSKGTPRQSFTVGFSHTGLSSKCRWSINKLIISWFLTQQPYQEEPCSSQTRTEPNTAPVLLTDSRGVPRAPAQRQIIVLPP